MVLITINTSGLIKGLIVKGVQVIIIVIIFIEIVIVIVFVVVNDRAIIVIRNILFLLVPS